MDDWEPVQRACRDEHQWAWLSSPRGARYNARKMQEQGKPLLMFFESLSSAMMLITHWVIWLSPVGVFFLVASKITDMQSLERSGCSARNVLPHCLNWSLYTRLHSFFHCYTL